MKHITLTFLLSLLAITLTSCLDSDKEKDGDSTTIYQNFVTFKGYNANQSVFEYQTVDDSPMITLTSDTPLYGEQGKDIEIGTRLLIVYTMEDGYVYGKSGKILLRSARYAIQASVTTAPHEQAIEANAPIGVVSMARSGIYLNLQAIMPAVEGRKFKIIADESTLDTDMPHLYVTTEVPENVEEGINANSFVSFNIADVWNKESARGVTVHVNNSANIYQTEFEFLKTN